MAGQGSAGNVIAALCSFFIPGLGQLLQGRLFMAIIQFVLAGSWVGSFTFGPSSTPPCGSPSIQQAPNAGEDIGHWTLLLQIRPSYGYRRISVIQGSESAWSRL